jgi:uncharacterized protein (TIGR00369 family)
MNDSNPQTRMDLVQAYTPPHAAALGITIAEIEADRCVMAMPFKPELVTIGDVVHGGAIATLIDMAVTVAAWASDEVPESPAGSTVSLSINFASAARGVDLLAEGRVVRRGRRLSACEVEVRDPEGKLIAHGIATYNLG